ncbi:MAG: SEC-C domain-containing protein [Bryobacteraceae bacterium]|nr:SEC-C domain-containing protein [Bryobacteraceae bacterium]
MFPVPAEFPSLPVYDLLAAAAGGRAGVDHRFLKAILDRGEAALPGLLRFAGEDRSSDLLSLDLLLVDLFRHLRTPEAMPFFASVIRRSHEDIPDEVIEAVAPLGAAALETLLELYREFETSDIAFLLAELGVRDPRILEILLDCLETDALLGGLALGIYGDPAAKPALEAMLRQIPEEDRALRYDLEASRDEIDHPKPPREREPFDIWAEYPRISGPALELLSEADILEMTRSADAEYRARAAASFFPGKLSRPARERLLEMAKTDDDPKVRARCWEALSDASESAEIRAAMLAVAADPRAPVEERGGAAVGLSFESAHADVAACIRLLYENPAARAKALEAMWRSADRQFASFIPPHLDDADPAVKRQAILGAGYFNFGAESGRLKKLLNDDTFRDEALFAYALCIPAEISRGRIRGLFRRIEDAAAGLSDEEADTVRMALDQRLIMHGLDPVFENDDADSEEPIEEPTAEIPKAGRNEPCPCGSGKKYKKCHGA